jgi:hypothetical protein
MTSEHTHVSNRASPLEPAARAADGSTGSDRFRTDIEALRAIAVLAVVGFHAGVPGFSGGYVGVDVFFVISGFLITGQMLRDEQGSGFRFGRFYARRIRRLLPVATLVIITVLVGSLLFESPIYQESTADDARSAALFYSNFRFEDQATDYFQEDNPPSPYQHFWSLSAEEQFYFVWPSLFALTLLGAAASVARRRRRLAVALVAISAVSFVVSPSVLCSPSVQRCCNGSLGGSALRSAGSAWWRSPWPSCSSREPHPSRDLRPRFRSSGRRPSSLRGPGAGFRSSGRSSPVKDSRREAGTRTRSTCGTGPF